MFGIEDLIHNVNKEGIPQYLSRAYDNALKAAGKKLWRGTLQVAASGFGKGLLLTAAAVLVGAAVLFGIAAAGGATSVLGVPLLIKGALMTTAATVPEAIGIGLASAGSFLLSGAGLLALGVGGTLGAVSDVHKRQGQITAQMAKVEAAEFARAREENQARAIIQETELEKEIAPETAGFAAREAAKRAAEQSAARTL